MSKFLYRGLIAAHRRRHDNSGFTLPELLISMAVLVLIMGALVAAFMVSIDNQGSIQSRVTDSASAQLTAAFYVRDVQSAIAITTDDISTTTNLGPAVCP